MIIRKLFKFENAHIVRECSTLRCSKNIHGHSYKVEVLLESNYLDMDRWYMIFGLTRLLFKRGFIKELVFGPNWPILTSSWEGSGGIGFRKDYYSGLYFKRNHFPS